MALILICTQQIKKIENKDYWINFALLSLHINKKSVVLKQKQDNLKIKEPSNENKVTDLNP